MCEKNFEEYCSNYERSDYNSFSNDFGSPCIGFYGESKKTVSLYGVIAFVSCALYGVGCIYWLDYRESFPYLADGFIWLVFLYFLFSQLFKDNKVIKIVFCVILFVLAVITIVTYLRPDMTQQKEREFYI